MSDLPHATPSTVVSVPEQAAPAVQPQQAQKVAAVTDLTLVTALRSQMTDYVTAMGPGKQVSEATAIKYQTQLWQTMRMMFSQPSDKFPELWGEFLRILDENSKGAFSKDRAFRAVGDVRIPPVDRKNYHRLLTLALDTANIELRGKRLAHMNLRYILRGFTSVEVLNRLSDFYRI